MAASQQNLVIDQGADYYRTFTITSSDTNLPSDLTGYVFAGQIRRSVTATANVAFTVGIVEAVLGQAYLSLSNADTMLLVDTKYVYDIEITSVTNKKSRILEGMITINPNVTR